MRAVLFALLLACGNPAERGPRGRRPAAPTTEPRAAGDTTAALAARMTDTDALARFPDPVGSAALHSSWSRSQERDPHANDDRGWFEGERTFGGRTEHVLVDMDGPGAIVRIWSANPDKGGTVRLRLDGASEPVVEMPLIDWLEGERGEPRGKWGRGHQSLLPIPFAKHATLTVDAGDKPGLYWHVDTVRWPQGTPVQTWTGWPAIRPGQVWKQAPEGTRTVSGGTTLELPAGPAAIRRLRVRGGGTLVLEFDGETTAEIDLADLRSGPYDTGPWAFDGQVLTARWTMPWAKSASVSLRDATPGAALEADVGPWVWDDRSMHLHAATRSATVSTAKPGWFEYLETSGRGVYVGDVLAIDNPAELWWGEGDEEVAVDGAITHRGTGTEDWYGYAWCDTGTFSGPFIAKPFDEAEGQAQGCEHHRGHSVQARFRALDAIPFTRSIRVRFEVWHNDRKTRLGLRSTSFWYAVP